MDKIGFKELEKKLISLHGKIETIEEIEKLNGNKFNVFNILGIQRREVETHSFFLHELINPKGSHSQDIKYLEIFMKNVLNLHSFKFENVIVGRETLIDESRRIDFTIENDEYYIAIEMKIDATDKDKQLKDYFDYAKKQKKDNSIVYYLTLDGKEAEEISHNGAEYEKISFAQDILNFIELSIEKSAELPTIRENLVQYLNLIKEITNQSIQGVEMEAIEIIDNPKVAQAATEMSRNLAKAWAKKEIIFWNKLKNKLEKYLTNNNLDKTWSVVDDFADNMTVEYISNLKKRDLRGVYLENNDFYFGCYIHNAGGFEYYLGSEHNLEEIANKTQVKNKCEENERYITSKYKYNFSKDYDDPTYDIFDSDKLEQIVEDIYQEVVGYMSKIANS